ncbi:uncharacterized protein BP5553_06012 [Venustampulla echinocandica]|uniref:PWWP domain-containing protein n=1 Tax=Venustampulla echinocandica TaxID=2656787 RepID=A0A370TMA1_9HELO|nr:uncharacterized protein BP5553_06012 [Venustampulla echinocandica]RDL36660.1 hypothetical protein BP5553_06012 [Venustampulla echinocandica]
MSDETNPQPSPVPPAAEPVSAPEDMSPTKETGGANGSKDESGTRQPAGEVATEAPASIESLDPDNTNSKQPTDVTAKDKPTDDQQDVEMADIAKEKDAPSAAVTSPDASGETPTSASKGKGRRKSGGVPEHKTKKLNKKASKAKMTHTDAKPGDYFFVRLKGYPLWPAIISDESMLPAPLLKSRPNSAARPDGTYREGYEDGGPKAKDRTFPVMYLHTNEFGWIPNFDLVDLDPEEVAAPKSVTRKDLQAAYQLAAEQHNLQYYKDVLRDFMETRAAEIAAKEAEIAAKEAAKEAAKAAKAAKQAKKSDKSEKRKSVAVVEDDEDAEMAEAAEVDSEANGGPSEKPAKKTKKRKATDDAETPQRADSVKKPRPTIKLNTPKTANGAATPKSTKDQSVAKSSKAKAKKPAATDEATSEAAVPKKPEPTAEQKRATRQTEVLFLRHKLQKALLTRDQEPKAEEMKQMSEFVTKLEGYSELEVSIIRATKINKVLKAILKLNTIPREEEFKFKSRSQSLLDKWNKLLASQQGTPGAPANTNGVGSEDKTGSKASPVGPANGVKESSDEPKPDEKGSTEASPVAATKEDAASDKAVPPPAEEATKESTVQPAAEATAA